MEESKLSKQLKEINWTFATNLSALISFFIISIILIILRSLNVITASWVWILVPICTPIAVSLLIILILIISELYFLIKNGDFINFLGENGDEENQK